MPCESYSTSEDFAILHKELDDASRLLCEAMTLLMEPTPKDRPSVELAAWWEAHKKKDTARRMREAQEEKDKRDREAALSRLSSRERRLLSLRVGA